MNLCSLHALDGQEEEVGMVAIVPPNEYPPPTYAFGVVSFHERVDDLDVANDDLISGCRLQERPGVTQSAIVGLAASRLLIELCGIRLSFTAFGRCRI